MEGCRSLAVAPKPKKKQRRQQPKTPTTIEDIPDEVMQDILSRLPITSIPQSRYVSTKWHNLIKHPSFSKMHYTFHAFQNPSPNPTSLILVDHYGDVTHVPDLESCDKVIKLKKFPKQSPLYSPRLVGSVNGFICFDLYGMRFQVCNPVTGDLVYIDKPNPSVDCVCHGFGWAKSTNEFKLVVMHINKDEQWMLLQLQICTIPSATTTWKTLATIPHDIDSYKNPKGVFVNGRLHWFLLKPRTGFINPIVQGIMSIDVENESIGQVSIPHQLTNVNLDCLHLRKLQGCLMLTHFSDSSLNVWLLNDYSVHESWVQQFVIPQPPERPTYRFSGLLPLAMLKNGNIVVEIHGKMIAHTRDSGNYTKLTCYDPQTRTHTFQKVQGQRRRLFSIYPFVGTLGKFLKDTIAMEELG